MASNEPPLAPRPLEVAILAAAEKLFAERGYAATSMENIATEIKHHKSTIFYYVESKQELLTLVLDSRFAQYVERLEAITRLDTSYLARLVSAVANHLEFVFRSPAVLKVFLNERKNLEGSKADEYLAASHKYESLFECLIEGGCAAGEFIEVDAKLTARVILGALNWTVEWYSHDGDFSETQVTDAMVNLLVTRGLSTAVVD